MTAVFARTTIIVKNETGVFVLVKAPKYLQSIGFDYKWQLESGPSWMEVFNPEPIETLNEMPVFAEPTVLAA